MTYAIIIKSFIVIWLTAVDIIGIKAVYDYYKILKNERNNEKMIKIYVEFKAPEGKRKYQRFIVDDNGYRIYAAFLDIRQLCRVLDLTEREAYELIEKSEDGYKAPII